jgi:hypothetical protein
MTIKHGDFLFVYQLSMAAQGLVIRTPLKLQEAKEGAFEGIEAWHLAMTIKYRPFIIAHKWTEGLLALLWMKATDAFRMTIAREGDENVVLLHTDWMSTTEEQIAALDRLPRTWRHGRVCSS